jgi:hypothetical protein
MRSERRRRRFAPLVTKMLCQCRLSRLACFSAAFCGFRHRDVRYCTDATLMVYRLLERLPPAAAAALEA